jgi:methanogenic corrinoid protein MtbC1
MSELWRRSVVRSRQNAYRRLEREPFTLKMAGVDGASTPQNDPVGAHTRRSSGQSTGRLSESDERQVMNLRHATSQREHSQSVRDELRPASGRAIPRQSMSGGRDDLAGLRQRYLAAQLAGNRREALRVVVGEGIDLGISVLDLQRHVVQEAQREIGRLWQENEINIAQEHMATAISQMALAQLYDQAPLAPSNHKKVVVACVEGELHEFPARLVADALELSGFEVRYLGADVPLHSLLRMLASERPDLLALSATMAFHLPAMRQAVKQVREAAPALPIVIGGAACSDVRDLAAMLGAAANGHDASELVAIAQRLLGVSTASERQSPA